MEQGSQEWILARVGSLGASQVHAALAKTESGWGASRANLMADLICEQLTGRPTETYQSAAMLHGTETEPQARAAYEFRVDAEVIQIGIAKHPTIAGTHASPDGLIGSDGLVEFKCPQSSTHINTLLGSPISGQYIKQMQWQLACTRRQWCDWVSFDPRMPESMCLYIERINRDDKLIAELEKEVQRFLDEVAGKVSKLREKYGRDK